MPDLIINRTWVVDGTAEDPTSIKLQDSGGVFGVKKLDDSNVIVPSGTNMVKVSTGVYKYTVNDVAAGTYVVAEKIVYLGQTFFFESNKEVAADVVGIVTVDEVMATLGIPSPTAVEIAVVEMAITKAVGAIRSFLGFDPILRQHTEFHPQQSYQAQIQRGIWEVMEQRAVLRQVSEAATNELQLAHRPVRQYPAMEVRIDYDGRAGSKTSSFGTETIKQEGADFWPNYDSYDAAGWKVCSDGILRTIGLWPTTANTVKVVYTAGYTNDEFHGLGGSLDASPIWDVCLEEASRRARRVIVESKGQLGLPAGVLQSESLGDYNYSLAADVAKRLYSGDLLADSKAKLSNFVNYGAFLGM